MLLVKAFFMPTILNCKKKDSLVKASLLQFAIRLFQDLTFLSAAVASKDIKLPNCFLCG